MIIVQIEKKIKTNIVQLKKERKAEGICPLVYIPNTQEQKVSFCFLNSLFCFGFIVLVFCDALFVLAFL